MATPNRSAADQPRAESDEEALQACRSAEGSLGVRPFDFCLPREDSPNEAAEQVFRRSSKTIIGWNEVRVSTIRELTDALKPLVNPAESAARLKQTLHSVFESVYEFDIESLKKQNIGQAAKALQKYNGTTPFAVAYVTQYALGGHSIPLNRGDADHASHRWASISDVEFSQGDRAWA